MVEKKGTYEECKYTCGTSSLTPLFKNRVPANCCERRAMRVRKIGRPYTEISVYKLR